MTTYQRTEKAESGNSNAPLDVAPVPPPAAQQEQPSAPTGVAALMKPMTDALFGPVPVRIEYWDGSGTGPTDGPGTLYVRTPDAIRRIVWAPGELGLGRAFVSGELDVDGDLCEMIAALRPAGARLRNQLSALPAVVRTAFRLHLVRPPLPAPPEEAKPRGRLHTRGRDAQSISHHYDVGNAFYQLLLGETMAYSCARFVEPTDSLDTAQNAKHELICRKLGLHERPGKRLLDVGCGWGGMAIHAARHHGARVVGITISKEQAELARQRIHAAGVDDLIEIRLQDYRDLADETFDAISSIGMFEHVGKQRMAAYFSTLRPLLAPGGRMLNHAISSPGGSKLGKRSFTHRYVFPDGELMDVGDVVLAMDAVGFEVRDVESLREHYAQTARTWVANLREQWDEAVELVGEGRVRVWLLYLSAFSIGFDDGGVAVHQMLGVVPDRDGNSGMPRTRRAWN